MSRFILRLATTALATVAILRAHAAPELLLTATLPPTGLDELTPAGAPRFDLAAAYRNGLHVTNQPSFGSGLAVNRQGEVFGLTDRGPNSEFKPKGGKKRRVLPVPEFAPGIVRLNLRSNTLAWLEFIALRDCEGKPLTGRSNERDDEPCYASTAALRPMPPDPGGVDPEGLRCLPDGRFLISDEYSPSLLVVATNGEVLVRYTPASKTLPGANYPVKPILPATLAQRRTNRGFECLALSAEGRTAYLILQSPLGDETDGRYASCRLHRVVELDVSDPLAARVTAMFLLPADAAKELPGTKKQTQVKLNDAEWLGPRQLLVLEQGKASARLLVADFNQATNLLEQKDADSLRFEDSHADLNHSAIHPAHVTTFLDLAAFPAIDSTKLEGLAILAPDRIALANDNDFGIGENDSGEPSKIWVLRGALP